MASTTTRKRAAVTTPAGALARVLRDLGLDRGPRGDFATRGEVVNGERQHTFAVLYTLKARAAVLRHAERIEEETAALGYPFRVKPVNGGGDAMVDNSRPPARPAQPVEVAPVPAPAAAPVAPTGPRFVDMRGAELAVGDVVNARSVHGGVPLWAVTGRVVGFGRVRVLVEWAGGDYSRRKPHAVETWARYRPTTGSVREAPALWRPADQVPARLPA